MKRLVFVLLILLAGTTIVGFIFFDRRVTATGGLQIITNNKPSSVFINGQYLEKTPFIEKNLKPGTYPIRIEPDDPSLAPYETNITLRSGLLSVITWKPEPTPELSGGVIYEMEPLKSKKQAEVSFITIPDGTIIAFDEQEKEFAPTSFSHLSEGQHTFEITLPSYETQKHTLNVVKGYRVQVRAKLAKLAPTATGSFVPTTQLTSEEQPTPATKSAQTATSSANLGKEITIKSTNFFNDGIESLRVRGNPSTESPTLGFAEVGKSYPYLNESLGGWYKILFEQKEGWVSSSYADIKN